MNTLERLFGFVLTQIGVMAVAVLAFIIFALLWHALDMLKEKHWNYFIKLFICLAAIPIAWASIKIAIGFIGYGNHEFVMLFEPVIEGALIPIVILKGLGKSGFNASLWAMIIVFGLNVYGLLNGITNSFMIIFFASMAATHFYLTQKYREKSD